MITNNNRKGRIVIAFNWPDVRVGQTLLLFKFVSYDWKKKMNEKCVKLDIMIMMNLAFSLFISSGKNHFIELQKKDRWCNFSLPFAIIINFEEKKMAFYEYFNRIFCLKMYTLIDVPTVCVCFTTSSEMWSNNQTYIHTHNVCVEQYACFVSNFQYNSQPMYTYVLWNNHLYWSKTLQKN